MSPTLTLSAFQKHIAHRYEQTDRARPRALQHHRARGRVAEQHHPTAAGAPRRLHLLAQRRQRVRRQAARQDERRDLRRAILQGP